MLGLLGPQNTFFQKKNLERSNYCSPRHIQAMLPLLALLKVSKMEQLEAM